MKTNNDLDNLLVLNMIYGTFVPGYMLFMLVQLDSLKIMLWGQKNCFLSEVIDSLINEYLLKK